MEVVVFRHGIALDREEAAAAGYADEQRPLTDEGRRRTRAAAAGLSAMLAKTAVDRVAASPLLRARQTGEILAERMGGPAVLECPALAPGAGAPAVDEWLGQHADAAGMVLVGHEPDLSAWVSWACVGTQRQLLSLKKAGACLVRFPGQPAPGAGALRWLLEAGQLRALG